MGVFFIWLLIALDQLLKTVLGDAEMRGDLLHPPASFGHLLDRVDLEFVWITLTTHGTSSEPSVRGS